MPFPSTAVGKSVADKGAGKFFPLLFTFKKALCGIARLCSRRLNSVAMQFCSNMIEGQNEREREENNFGCLNFPTSQVENIFLVFLFISVRF